MMAIIANTFMIPGIACQIATAIPTTRNTNRIALIILLVNHSIHYLPFLPQMPANSTNPTITATIVNSILSRGPKTASTKTAIPYPMPKEIAAMTSNEVIPKKYKWHLFKISVNTINPKIIANVSSIYSPLLFF